MPESPPTGAPPRALVIVATVLGVALAVGVAVFGLSQPSRSGDHPRADGPLPLVPVEAPKAGSRPCAKLVAALPRQLPSADGDLARRRLADPAPEGAAAWGSGDPVVLRCGLRKPPELAPDSALQVVNGVQWLWLEAKGSATWYVVDRPVYVAVTVPEAAGTGPVQALSDLVADTLPATPVRP